MAENKRLKPITLKFEARGPNGTMYKGELTYENMQPKHLAEFKAAYLDKVEAAVKAAPVLADGTFTRGTMNALQIAAMEAMLALAKSDKSDPNEGGYSGDLRLSGADVQEQHLRPGKRK